MVDLDWVVPEGMSQVWRRLEVANINGAWLSSGTFAGTFAVSADPYRNYRCRYAK